MCSDAGQMQTSARLTPAADAMMRPQSRSSSPRPVPCRKVDEQRAAQHGEQFLRMERHRGGVQRRVVLPRNADVNGLSAELTCGVLIVRVKKTVADSDAGTRRAIAIE